MILDDVVTGRNFKASPSGWRKINGHQCVAHFELKSVFKFLRTADLAKRSMHCEILIVPVIRQRRKLNEIGANVSSQTLISRQREELDEIGRHADRKK